MRLILLPLIAATSLGASAVPVPVAGPNPDNCKDRIQQVRQMSGQPVLDKMPAAPGQGYLIAAVDKRIDGCAVMQMHRSVNDLRPLPSPQGPARLQPAR